MVIHRGGRDRFGTPTGNFGRRAASPRFYGRIVIAPAGNIFGHGCSTTLGRYIFLRNGRGILAQKEPGESDMAIRKSALKSAPARPELDRLLQQARETSVTDEQLFEQRISFAYGNAPEGSGITKETARSAANSILMRTHAR
jgi:hypothetical protein